jgi:DNA-binding transcriptional LysR family regulator
MNETLDSRRLCAFRVLARTGSFTQTARELHITQSGVSHSMKALEEEIGCRLLDRLGKKVALTRAGEQLLQHTEIILHEMELARESLTQLDKRGRGRLRVGASTTACQHLIPPVLREFKERFPDHAVSLEPGETPQLIASLLRQQIDLALTVEAGKEPKLESRLLFTDELQFVVSAMHPWAQAKRVVRDEIPRQNYILCSKHSITSRLIEEYFHRQDMALNTIIEAGSMEATKELVKLGLGVSMIAPWIVQKEIEEGSLVALPLGRKKLQRCWGILHCRGHRLSPAEETFISLCESASIPLRHQPGKVKSQFIPGQTPGDLKRQPADFRHRITAQRIQ